MDYGPLGTHFHDGSHDNLGGPNHVWNDRLGEFFCTRHRRNSGLCNHKDPYDWTQNYDGGAVCVGRVLDNYYVDCCP